MNTLHRRLLHEMGTFFVGFRMEGYKITEDTSSSQG